MDNIDNKMGNEINITKQPDIKSNMNNKISKVNITEKSDIKSLMKGKRRPKRAGRPKMTEFQKAITKQLRKEFPKQKKVDKPKRTVGRPRKNPILTDKQIAEQEAYNRNVRAGFLANPLMWAKLYFPYHFRLPSSPFHQVIMMKAQSRQFLAIAAPRGSSKTTITGFAYPLHQICFKQRRFIVYISNISKQSTLLLYTLKQEIKGNKKLKADYGVSIPKKDAEDVTIFRHPDGFETMVICLGADQMGNIRGRKFGAYRPDLILLDDVENDELVRSAERRQKLQEDFDNAVVPAGDIDTKYIIIGTILHDDSLLAKLMSKDQYKEYDKIFFKGLYKDNKTKEYFSLWPEKMSVDWLMDYWKNKPYTFAREIQNNPAGAGTEDIDKRDFRYWRIENMQAILFDEIGNITARYHLSDCRAAIASDLAWEDKQESDYTAIIPAFLTPNSDVLIDDYFFRKGVRPNEFEEYIFTLEERLRAITGTIVHIGFEKAKLEKVMKWFLKQAMRKRNRYLSLKDLRCSKEKVERIVTVLQPRYSQHTIYHKHNMGELEIQLTRLRSATHDDLADAAAMAVRLLQYPKSKRNKQIIEDDVNFMKLRKWNIDKQKRGISIGQFGIATKRYTIPAITCPI